MMATDNHFDYKLESKCLNGNIIKLERLSLLGENIYNLGFGDLNLKTSEISDFVVSNNADTE